MKSDLINYLDKAEQAVDSLNIAIEVYAEALRAYRIKKGKVCTDLKQSGMAVTLIRDVSQGMTADLKSEVITSEGVVEKFRHYIYLYKQRATLEGSFVKVTS